MPTFQHKAPFVPSLLVEFRKRLTEDILSEINDIILSSDDDDDDAGDGDDVAQAALDGQIDGSEKEEEIKNGGTLILDATCAPQNIKYPQDTNLLFDTREKLEDLITAICRRENIYKPRTYCRQAERDAQRFLSSKKRTKKLIRRTIRQQLQYIRRNLGYIYEY